MLDQIPPGLVARTGTDEGAAAQLSRPGRFEPDLADHHALEYRPHLDGIRALAVLMVFVFHAARPALHGGFIGVDIFFVLSGYLITLILIGYAERQKFRTISVFYTRRLKRLLPASLLLLLAVATRESLWGSILDLQNRLREIRATTLYVANWNLVNHSDDYFVDSATVSPLRHMWSLAVEEQFYLVWPLLVVLGIRIARGRLNVLAGICTSLTAASVVVMAVRYSPENVASAYYGTDARVFQPLLGALLAIVCSRRRHVGPRSGPPALALPVGLAAVAGLAVMSRELSGTDSSYFRGGALLVAVLTCSLIWSLERSPRLAAGIGWWPLAALGRISYGFYLWHWPIVVWVRPPAEADWLDRRVVNVVQFAVTLALATASYVLVERPIRSLRPRRLRFTPFVVAASAMILVITSAGVLLEPPTTGRAAMASEALADHSVFRCPEHPRPCVRYEPGDPAAPTVVTVGDSHAQMWYPAMMALAEQYGFRYVEAAASGCPIGRRLLATGVDGELHKPSNFTCYEAIPGIYEEVLDRWNPDLIIATSSNERNPHVTNGEVVEPGTPEHREEMQSALEVSVDILTSQGSELVFLDVMQLGPAVSCLDRDPPNQGSCVRPIPAPPFGAEVNDVFAAIDEERAEVRGVIDFTHVVCPGGACPLVVDGVVVRYDGQHFTGTQSLRMAPLLDQQLRALGVDLGRL